MHVPWLQWAGQPTFVQACSSFLVGNVFPVGCTAWTAPFKAVVWAGQPFLVALGAARPCLVWLDSHNKYMLCCNFVGPEQLERVAGSSGLSSHGCQRERSSCPCKGAAKGKAPDAYGKGLATHDQRGGGGASVFGDNLRCLWQGYNPCGSCCSQCQQETSHS